MKVNRGLMLRNAVSRGLLAGASRAVLVVVLLFAATGAAVAAPQAPVPPGIARHLIVENVGQYAPETRFQLRTGSNSIWLAGDAIWLAASTSPSTGVGVRFTFPGANPSPVLEPYGPIDAAVSYLTGSDPTQWHTGVPVWAGVRYRDLYPGVDLIVGGYATGDVPWRFEAHAGADLQAVALRVEGAAASADGGALRLQAGSRSLTLALPTWATADGQAVPSAVRASGDAFALAPTGGAASVAVAPAAAPDAAPDAGDLIFNTTTGGSALDAGYGVAVDFAGNSYVTGETQSSNFPTLGPYDGSYNGGSDAFVAKYDSAGTLKYATYLGGALDDMGLGIAVEGNLAYVVGETASTNFPVIGASVVSKDIFVAALNATGSALRYVTRIGGNDVDYGYGIAVEGLEAYVVGQTFSTNLSGTNCAAASATNADLVAAKLTSAGALSYTTCLGGGDTEIGYGIALLNGEAYVTGVSFSADFPGGLSANSGDVLVARLNAGGAVAASTLIGGSGEDTGRGVAVDSAGNVYVAGMAGSNDLTTNDFPVTTGTPAYAGGVTDGIVMKLSPSLTVNFATYLGGADEDDAYRISADTVQALYVGGATLSSNFRTTAGAYDTTSNGGFDPFATRLHLGSAAADKVTYSTYLGASHDDYGFGADTDTGGNNFVVGSTQTTVDPATSAASLWKVQVSTPPAAPGVSISITASKVGLTWSPVGGATQYQVVRSLLPYHKPGNGSTILPVANSPFTDDVLSQVNAYFYFVKAANNAPAAGANSNQVGKFTFQLVKGG